MKDFADIWTYLAQGPLLWLAATLAAWARGDAAYRASGKSPLVNAVPVAVVILAVILWTTSTPYATYFEGAQFVTSCLAPPPLPWPCRCGTPAPTSAAPCCRSWQPCWQAH